MEDEEKQQVEKKDASIQTERTLNQFDEFMAKYKLESISELTNEPMPTPMKSQRPPHPKVKNKKITL